MIDDIDAFASAYGKAFQPLDKLQRQGLAELLPSLLLDPDIGDAPWREKWLAYMLATVKHECADVWRPIAEIGFRGYFRKYESNTALGQRLGNTQPGDGYLFRGRGYVQITGRGNYLRLGTRLGTPLLLKPDAALLPATAYRILSVGMREGLFTGKRLIDYINARGCDYLGARRIINGQDDAALIAGYAVKIEAALQAVKPTGKGG